MKCVIICIVPISHSSKTHRNALTQVGACVGSFNDGVLTGVIQNRALGQRNVSRHPSDGYPRERGRERVCEMKV